MNYRSLYLEEVHKNINAGSAQKQQCAHAKIWLITLMILLATSQFKTILESERLSKHI